MKFNAKKMAKILLAVFVMVFSFTVLSKKVPETKYVQETIQQLDKSEKTVMSFSGATIATSLAISALPNDFASPLANTVSDLNTYFVFMLAVIFVERLIVIVGTKLSLCYVIPAACLLFLVFELTKREVFKNFAAKMFILGLSLVLVIPFSTHFTETVCDSYLEYIDETIEEANAGAEKINGVMATEEGDVALFDRIANVFENTIKGVSDLLLYFRNMIKKCVNAVAIMVVTTFVLPLLILMLFRWLLKELFKINIPTPKIQIRIPQGKKNHPDDTMDQLQLEEKI